jgi:hypothetical protein
MGRTTHAGHVLIAGVGALMLSLLAGSAVSAATLEGIQGEVMINTGAGYRFVSGVVELKPGDMVIANAGGTAQLMYGDGCTVPVQAGGFVTVSADSPCLTTQANGDGAPAINPTTFTIGAVVVGAGVGAAFLLKGNSSDKPASP